MNGILLAIALLGTLAIFATTKPGQVLAKRMGFRDHIPGAASHEDVRYLEAACGGDPSEVERRLATERDRYPELSEAEHYRRAIRKVFAERQA